MSSAIPPTTLRLTEEDRAVLAVLKGLTGLSSTSDAVRLALREAVLSRTGGPRAARSTKTRKS